MKRILALGIALLMVLGVLTSCVGWRNSAANDDISGGDGNDVANGDNVSSEKHDACKWQVLAVVQEKDCVHDGIVNYVCSCGQTKTEISKALGHSFSDWQILSDSTCKVSGTQQQTCSVCGASNSKYLDKPAHNYSITEKIINGTIHSDYLCLNCSDHFTILSEIASGFKSSEPQHLFDCDPSFSFEIVCNGDEAYIRKNLVITDTYFENSKDENADFALCDYALEQIEAGIWKVTPTSPYTAGNTYKAKRSAGVVFKEYGANDLTFSVFKEETNVMDFNDNIIFLQALENQNPGYYPYTVEYSENSGLYWVTLGKVDGLNVGNIVCVGNATNTEELLSDYNEKNTFGKIETISYSIADKTYYIGMSVPEFDELFDELDIYSTNPDYVGNVELVSAEEMTAAVTSALYNSKDFINFMGATYVTATEFLENRGASSSIGTFKEFLNNIKIDNKECHWDPTTGIITANIKIVGSVAIPVTVSSSGNTREVGNVVISFSAYVNLDFLKFETSFNQQEIDNAKNEELTKIKLGAIQSVTTGFTFNVSMDVDYSMEATPYVLNLSSRVYHFESCKHVAAMSKSNIMRVSAETLFGMIKDGSVSASNECGTCRPVSAMKSDNYILNKESKTIHLHDCMHLTNTDASKLSVSGAAYGNLELSGYKACESCKPYSRYTNSFSESLLKKMQSGDFGHNIEEIKKLADEATEPDSTHKVPVAEIPLTLGPCQVRFELYAYITFTLNASLTYEYEQTVYSRYGFELKSEGLTSYYQKVDKLNKNTLSITGQTTLEIGALGVIKFTFIGLEDCLYASINAQCGIYATASGALQRDFMDGTNNYMVGYFECGLASKIYGEIKIPFFKIFTATLCEGKVPVLTLGYENVVYKFTNVIDTLLIDANVFSLNRDDLLNVSGFDLIRMEQVSTKLSYFGLAGRYSVDFSLKNGNKCYIKDGYLYVTDDSESFTDVLTVTVTGYDTWNSPVPANTKIDLPAYSVTLVYDPIDDYSKGLEFTSNGYGSCYVSGIGTCTDTEIKVPPRSPAGDKVVAIGIDAFYGCNSITSVILPSSVTKIDDGAFMLCRNLTSITFKGSIASIGNNAFRACESLIDISIPMGITSIGNYAFAWCESLAEIKIPDTVVNVGEYAFYSCTALQKATVSNKLSKISFAMFSACTSLKELIIPEGVASIDANAFDHCMSLSSVVIPNSVTKIGYAAFNYCIDLKTIDLPNGITEINGHTFADCSSLISIEIPDGVTSIGDMAFFACNSLARIVIPESVTEIGLAAFFILSSYDIYFSGTAEQWAKVSVLDDLSNATIHCQHSSVPIQNYSRGLEYTYVSSGDYYVVSGIGSCTDTEIIIPPVYNGKPVYAIADFAFDRVTNNYSVDIKSIVMGDNILIIGKSAFHGCSSLETVVLSSNVVKVSDFAFYECDSLEKVVVSDSVMEIGDWAFFGCASLTDVYYTGTASAWNSIYIKNSYNCSNADLLNANRHNNYVP